MNLNVVSVMECALEGAVGEFGATHVSQREAWIKRLYSPELDGEVGKIQGSRVLESLKAYLVA